MIYRVASLPKICFDCTVLYIVFTVYLFSPNALDYLGHVRKNEETLHVIQDRLPEVLEDSCKSRMKKGRLNTKGSRDKKTGVFTKTIGEKQWTPSFYSHGTLERWMEFGPKFFH